MLLTDSPIILSVIDSDEDEVSIDENDVELSDNEVEDKDAKERIDNLLSMAEYRSEIYHHLRKTEVFVDIVLN